jgi:hypothetical protein
MNKPIRYSPAVALAIALLAGNAASAQDETDALRFSMIQPQGTARSIGFGSALGSVGGEFSSLSVNPAGIGIYRRGELTVTPSMVFGSSSSEYTGNTERDNGAHFSFSNLGIVSARSYTGRRAQSGWTTSGFGFGITRTADFTRNSYYSGQNTTSSASFVFENDANVGGVSSGGQIIYPADLGYQSFLLDTLNGGYISNVLRYGTPRIGQDVSTKERGGITEIGLTFGGSYQEKLMLGGSLNIPILRYRRDRTITEYDLTGDNNNDFDNFQYHDQLRTNGAGINLKAGAIYKPVDAVRFGVAIHSPTWYSLTDIQNTSLTANTENYGIFYSGSATNTAQAQENQYEYSLRTPWRAVASATVMLGTMGFWSVDYEFVDYTSSRFNMDEGFSTNVSYNKSYQDAVNEVIKTYYTKASNVRTGLELRLDNFFLRGGFGYYGNPYSSGTYDNRKLPNAQRLEFSGGLGIRFESTFIDFAFVHRQYTDNEQPYTLPQTNVANTPYFGMIVPTATIKTAQNNAVLTFGVKF